VTHTEKAANLPTDADALRALVVSMSAELEAVTLERNALTATLCREVGGNWRSGDLQRGDVIGSRSKVNALNSRLLGECLPSVYLAHGDLTGCQECPEQHRRRLRRWQHGLRLDAAFELLVQSHVSRRGKYGGPLPRRKMS
jgi:hypothetical protein